MKRILNIAGQFMLWFLFWFFIRFWYLSALSVVLILIGLVWHPCFWAGIVLACITALIAVIRSFIKLLELGLFAAVGAGAGAVSSRMNAYNEKDKDPGRSL
ncbi:hypothetical protein SAMN06296952_0950 [Oscillospiraceae bacterium]|nr:hypothetical protein SAMN06296952_0950 [Oscillospiraceae bacterium]